MTAATATSKRYGKAAGRAAHAQKASGPGLGSTGEPIELRIEDVEEDPNQPRQTFSEEAMVELAESIEAHNVKVPISVHRHPQIKGRYIINDGARRYRASIRAGKETIAAVVVEAFSLVEQIVVNKVRDDTPPKDKARAFARLMKEQGWTQRQLAEKSRLSEAYVSQHLALLHLPAPIEAVFDSGRCADVTVINELVKAYKKKAGAVESWLTDTDQEITRGSVKLLREFLGDKHEPLEGEGLGDNEGRGKESRGRAGKEPDPDKIKKAIILGTYKRRAVRLITNKRWSAEGFAWVRYEDNGEEIEIEIEQLKLKRLMEA